MVKAGWRSRGSSHGAGGDETEEVVVGGASHGHNGAGDGKLDGQLDHLVHHIAEVVGVEDLRRLPKEHAPVGGGR